MFSWLFNRKPEKAKATAVPQRIMAQYAASLAKHHDLFSLADNGSADAAASPSVRAMLRKRARMLAENDSICSGLIRTLANDMIGTGPKLQIQTGDPSADEQIEKAWNAWAKASRFNEKLRTMRMARVTDGEIFCILKNNDNLEHPIKLDCRLIEADQVATPASFMDMSQEVDGIEFDEFGNPSVYHVLKSHPGDSFLTSFALEADRVSAEYVCHYYMVSRCGQSRGIPDLAPALMLFAYLRRYTTAEVQAAELAASLAATFESELPPDGSDADQPEAGDEMSMQPGMQIFLPKGWKAKPFAVEHPSTTYGEFKRELVSEIARCLNMPKNIALADSGEANFASGRLDHLIYWKALAVDQSHMEERVLDKVFRKWLDEAIRVEGLLPQSVRGLNSDIQHAWIWTVQQHAVDPMKEASAEAQRLASGTTTYAEVYGKEGKDWAEQFRQIAKEKELMKELGIETQKETAEDSPSTNEEEE